MGYKTILVHCNDRQRLPRLLDPAVTLCSTFGAHLVGVSVTPPIAVIGAGMPGTPQLIVLDEHAKAYQAENPAMKMAFEKAAHARNVTAEWREEDAGNSTVARAMMQHARTADLVIALQSVTDSKGSFDLDIPDRLALGCGRPVLIVPNKGTLQAIPKHIVIGWTDRREATRAVFDALPLLQRADKVTVVEVDPKPGQEAPESRAAIWLRSFPAARVRAWRRHAASACGHDASGPDVALAVVAKAPMGSDRRLRRSHRSGEGERTADEPSDS